MYASPAEVAASVISLQSSLFGGHVPLYDRPVRLLMREMADEFQLGPGDIFTREEALKWFQTRYPLVKEGTIVAHLTRLSTNNPTRLHYNARTDDDLFFQVESGRFRRYDPKFDPQPIHDRAGVPDGPERRGTPVTDADPTSSEFAYEHDLRDYLARNLHVIEPGLKLYEEEGVTGIEFPAGGRFVDILAVDAKGGYVVIELKVSRGYDRVVGQLLRYMNWIEMHQADPGQAVRGVVVAKEVSEDLRLACRRLYGVRLFEYALSVKLTAIPMTAEGTNHSSQNGRP